MPEKSHSNQRVQRRIPSQRRGRDKVELIFEATLRILDREGEPALTTNRIAEVAGVSIGTLYQYFADRRAILDGLVQRELDTIGRLARQSLQTPAPSEPGARIRLLVRAVLHAFGARPALRRQLVYSASAGAMSAERLHALVVGLLTSGGVMTRDQGLQRIPQAEAYVVVHAFVGVLRGLMAAPPDVPIRAVEDALVRALLALV